MCPFVLQEMLITLVSFLEAVCDANSLKVYRTSIMQNTKHSSGVRTGRQSFDGSMKMWVAKPTLSEGQYITWKPKLPILSSFEYLSVVELKSGK